MQENFNFLFSPERFAEELGKLGKSKNVAAASGVTEQTLSMIKNGKTEATTSTLAKIQSAYPSFDPIYIITGLRDVAQLANRVELLEKQNRELSRLNAALLNYSEKIEKSESMGKHKGKAMLPKVELYRIGNPKRVLFTQAWGLDRSQFGSYPARK